MLQSNEMAINQLWSIHAEHANEAIDASEIYLFFVKFSPQSSLNDKEYLVVPQPHRRRLQRAADFTGQPLDSFRQVFVRHGLPGLLLGLIFLSAPGALMLLSDSLATGANSPGIYLGVCILLVSGLMGYSWFLTRQWVASHIGWLLYLGLLCIWEEWVFRLALPQMLEAMGVGVAVAILVSNVIFGAAHYFTLRWRWQWCVGAFLGGLMFSRQIEIHGDLLMIIGIHWVATFLNTPRPPGGFAPAKQQPATD